MDAAQAELNRQILPDLDETDRPENAKRMLRAAVQLFARQGYKGTSVREIVQSAEVTNPMLYYYFDDKQGLFETLMDYLFEVLGEKIAEEMSGKEDLEATIDGIIVGYFNACKQSPVALQFVYTVLFGPTEGTPQFDIFEARQQIFEAIAAQIRRGMGSSDRIPESGFSAEFLTEQLLGLVNNHLMRALKRGEQGKEGLAAEIERSLTEEAARDLRNFFLEGANYAGD